MVRMSLGLDNTICHTKTFRHERLEDNIKTELRKEYGFRHTPAFNILVQTFVEIAKNR